MELEESERLLRKIVTLFTILVIILYFLLYMTSCTISFQNISTHGTATDLVDENQTPHNDIKPSLVIPINPGV